MFSYAVRLKQAQAGVYISASHNPPSDNGFKCYWEDGAQVLPPHDKAITDAVKLINTIKKDSANKELITVIGEDFDSVYRTRILQESVSHSRSAKIVYSPFHGTGQYGVLPILQEAGFTVVTVDEQMAPDGNFPNVPGGVPNPENRESNSLTALKVLETGADLGISTDPDADRLGLVIPKNGETVILDGNQTASLLAYFICSRLKEAKQLPPNGFLVRTVVTTPLLDAIAADFGLKIYNDLPVGFKFIGETIRQHEDFGSELYIFGGEESFGCLKGSYARDKDASSAALIAAEMVSWLKDQDKTVWNLFDELKEKYGDYHNDVVNTKFEGAEGFGQMSAIMNRLRKEPPKQIGPWDVIQVIDRKSNELKNAEGTVTGVIEGHTANILIFNFSEDGKNRAIIRPSGTEPKIKVYLSLHNKSTAEAEQLKTAVNELFN
jgi:phosphomannomutase